MIRRPCTFFMLLKATAHWQTLDAAARHEVFDEALATVFNSYPDLRMSHYAATALPGRCTDVVVWETADVSQYHDAIDALSEQAFFGTPLFEIVEVIAGVEDADTAAQDVVLGLNLRHAVFDGAAP
jgi:Darcynin, domain of unknown function